MTIICILFTGKKKWKGREKRHPDNIEIDTCKCFLLVNPSLMLYLSKHQYNKCIHKLSYNNIHNKHLNYTINEIHEHN